jgi:hypothetical protein
VRSDATDHFDVSFSAQYTVIGTVSGQMKHLLVRDDKHQYFFLKICTLDEFNAEYNAHALLDQKDCPCIVKLKLGCRISSTHRVIMLPKYQAFSWEVTRVHTQLFMRQLLTVRVPNAMRFKSNQSLQAIKCCHENEWSTATSNRAICCGIGARTSRISCSLILDWPGPRHRRI